MPPGCDRSGHGQTHNLIAGDNIIVTGGNLTSIQNVYSNQPAHQQVLDILYSRVSPPRIDGRLLYDSHAYEDLRRSCRNVEVDIRSERMITDLPNDSANNSTLHHESYHHFRRNYSRAVALSAAQRLADQGVLLASIILPSPWAKSCTRYIVPTLAYQLAQNIPPSAEYILTAIQRDPCIFERDTETQFTQLIEHPLNLAYKQASLEEIAMWPSVIVVDGNAHQFFPDSVPEQVVRLLNAVAVNETPCIRLSMIWTTSTTFFDKTLTTTLTLQQYTEGTACYFTWRIHG